MSRTPMKLAAVMLAAGVTVAACGTVKLGAAAITTSQRISTTTLSTQVANLNAAYQAHKSHIQLQYPVAEMPQQVLSWLIRFQVGDQLAAQHGITVSPTEAQQSLAAISASVKQNGNNETLVEAAVANGLPPDMLDQLGRYQAIETKLLNRLDGGQQPTSTAGQAALQAEFNKTQCRAAKSLNIQINPQFGELNYDQLAVVAAPGTVFRTAGPAPTASASGLTPAC